MLCIKHIGKCPCSRCLVEKKDIGKLGSDADRKTRTKKPWTDSKSRQNLIVRARNQIFKFGKGVASAAVEKLLNVKSMVPTVVGIF